MTRACPAPERLAAAAAGEDAAARAHAATCPRCEPVFAAQLATARLCAGLPAPALSASRRDAISDAIVVATLAAPPRPWRPSRAVIGLGVGVLATAAAVVLALAVATPAPPRRVATTAPPTAPPTTPAAAPAPPTPAAPPVPAPPPIVTALGRADRALSADGAALELRDGAVLVDTLASRPLAVVLPDRTTVTVAAARVEIRARRGALVAVAVFAGSAEIAEPSGRRAEVVTGEAWAPPARASAPPPPPPTAAEWFQRAWVALRAGDYAVAVDGFDRATDPAVAEDAAFWAAIAVERAGDRAAARARLEAFLARYPGSARAADAREHLAAP